MVLLSGLSSGVIFAMFGRLWVKCCVVTSQNPPRNVCLLRANKVIATMLPCTCWFVFLPDTRYASRSLGTFRCWPFPGAAKQFPLESSWVKFHQGRALPLAFMKTTIRIMVHFLIRTWLNYVKSSVKPTNCCISWADEVFTKFWDLEQTRPLHCDVFLMTFSCGMYS